MYFEETVYTDLKKELRSFVRKEWKWEISELEEEETRLYSPGERGEYRDKYERASSKESGSYGNRDACNLINDMQERVVHVFSFLHILK